MNNLAFAVSISNFVLGIILINSPLVQAATINYDFQVDIDSGVLSDDDFSGSFSFDNASLTKTGNEFLPLDSINFTFQGIDYTDVSIPSAEAAFVEGEFVGIGYSPEDSLAFMPGFFNIEEASFAYDIPDVGAGFGNVAYSEDITSPNPKTTPESSLVFSLLSLGVLGITLKKTQKFSRTNN